MRTCSGKPWSEEEIETMEYMLRKQEPIHHVAKVLGRTENAIRNAFRNVLFHQLLMHPPSKVAKNYKMTMGDLRESVIPDKYAVPINSRFPWGPFGAFFVAGALYYGSVLYQQWLTINC